MARTIKALSTPDCRAPLTAKLLGECIRARRTQLNLRLEDAALLCHVAKDTLSKLENGSEGVRLNNVLHVCQLLGIELMIKPWSEDI